jgi:hypothetical protein
MSFLQGTLAVGCPHARRCIGRSSLCKTSTCAAAHVKVLAAIWILKWKKGGGRGLLS